MFGLTSVYMSVYGRPTCKAMCGGRKAPLAPSLRKEGHTTETGCVPQGRRGGREDSILRVGLPPTSVYMSVGQRPTCKPMCGGREVPWHDPTVGQSHIGLLVGQQPTYKPMRVGGTAPVGLLASARKTTIRKKKTFYRRAGRVTPERIGFHRRGGQSHMVLHVGRAATDM